MKQDGPHRSAEARHKKVLFMGYSDYVSAG